MNTSFQMFTSTLTTHGNSIQRMLMKFVQMDSSFKYCSFEKNRFLIGRNNFQIFVWQNKLIQLVEKFGRIGQFKTVDFNKSSSFLQRLIPHIFFSMFSQVKKTFLLISQSQVLKTFNLDRSGLASN